MSREKLLPSPPGRRRCGSLHLARSAARRGFGLARLRPAVHSNGETNPVVCSSLTVSCCGGARRHSAPEAAQAERWLKCQPRSYERLEAYSFFGLSEEA